MDDLSIFLIASTTAALVLVAGLRALGRRYLFSTDALTVRAFGWLTVRKLPFYQATLEAVGMPADELARLRERLPGRKVVNLTRSIFSRWSVCGFVSTPEAILILPHPVARAVVSRNPPVRWRLMKVERRQRLEKLPEVVLTKWSRALHIATTAASLLLTGIAALHAAYAGNLIRESFEDRGLWIGQCTDLCLNHLCAPMLLFSCGAWVAVLAWMKKTPPLFVMLLALASSCSGPLLVRTGILPGWGNARYFDTTDLLSILCFGCCGVMLVRPLLTGLMMHRRESPMKHAQVRVARERDCEG